MRRPPDIKTIREFTVFRKLTTPSKIQDFIDGIPINFEVHRVTCRSPLMVLRHKEAHCVEGALLAAAAFWYQGEPPLLLDLRTISYDFDHVVALFKRNGRWGAVSKTNHAVLRYRDPIYATVRELALSYFNEYFLDSGEKTLREYSSPYDMLAHGDGWLTTRKNVWDISKALDDSQHFDILPKGGVRQLRPADKIEREVGKVTQWKRK